MKCNTKILFQGIILQAAFQGSWLPATPGSWAGPARVSSHYHALLQTTEGWREKEDILLQCSKSCDVWPWGQVRYIAKVWLQTAQTLAHSAEALEAFNSSFSGAEDTVSTFPFAPLFLLDFRSSWDRPPVAIADTLTTNASHAGQFINYTYWCSQYREWSGKPANWKTKVWDFAGNPGGKALEEQSHSPGSYL